MPMYTRSSIGGTFGKVMEPSGSGALLEEVCHWGWSLRFHS